MRLVCLFLLLVGCVSVPAQYVPTGAVPWKAQTQADQACIDLLAAGVDHGDPPLVIDRHGIHRDTWQPQLQRRGPGVVCIFQWYDPKRKNHSTDNMCHCQVFTRVPLKLMEGVEDIWFDACHELHKREAKDLKKTELQI